MDWRISVNGPRLVKPGRLVMEALKATKVDAIRARWFMVMFLLGSGLAVALSASKASGWG